MAVCEEFKAEARQWEMSKDGINRMLWSALLQAVIDARDLHMFGNLKFSNGRSEEFKVREMNKLEYFLNSQRAEFWTAMIDLDVDFVEKQVMDICHGRKTL